MSTPVAQQPSSGATLNDQQSQKSSVDHEKAVAQAAAAEPAPAPAAVAPVSNKKWDSGWRAWGVVAGAWLISFNGFGYGAAFGVYQDYYERIYLTGYSSSTISWIGSLQLALIFACGAVTGKLFDRGYYYHVMVAGMVLEIFSIWMLSLCHKDQFYAIILSQGIGMGLGAGMIYIPSMALVSHHFKVQRATAMMILSSGSSFGGALHSLMLNKLFLQSGLSFGNSVRASAGLVTGLLIIAALIMRTDYDAVGGPPAKGAAPGINWGVYQRMVTDSPFILSIVGCLFQIVGTFYPIFYIQLSANKHGIDPNFAFYTTVILNFLSAVGRLSPSIPWVVRTVGPLNSDIIASVGCAAIIFGMIGLNTAPTVGGFTAIAVFYGITSGAFFGTFGAVIGTLTKNPKEMGARLGFAFGVQSIGVLIGTPIAGAILGNDFRWTYGSVFAGVFVAFGSCLLILARFLLFQRQQREKAAAPNKA